MTKFECGKWYRVRKPENLIAPSPSFLRWCTELNEFDGKVMQCTYSFYDGQHGFLGNSRSAGFHSDWVIGPYNTREDAQTAMLNDAVKILEPIINSGPLKEMKHPFKKTPVGATYGDSHGVFGAVPYGGSYGKYFKKKYFNKNAEANMYNGIFDDKVQHTHIGLNKKMGTPVFYDPNKQKWVNFILKRDDLEKFVKTVVKKNNLQGAPGRDADESALYEFMKNYVSEVAGAVSLSADKEIKKLTTQLKTFKTELSNAKAEREILHGRDEAFCDRAKAAEKAISKEIQDVVHKTIVDYYNTQKIINHNAKSADKLGELYNALVETTKSCFESADKQFNQIYSEQDKAKVEAVKTRQDLEWTSESFKQELISLLKESRQREDTFKVADTVYQIDKNQLWVYDPNKKLWTTVKPSTQLVGDAKMRAELAQIDEKAEKDIDKIYTAFHERQKKREKTDSRHKKEFKRTKEPIVTLTGPLKIEEGTTVTIRAPKAKTSLLKKTAKWAAYTVGITSSAAAGVAAAVYFFPLVF